MPKITYEQIEPNIAEVEAESGEVTVIWKDPVTKKVVTRSSALMESDDSVMKDAKNNAKATAMSVAFDVFNEFIGNIFGGSVARITKSATTATETGMDSVFERKHYSQKSERDAVVAAFRKVEEQFRWDEDRELFVAAPAGVRDDD